MKLIKIIQARAALCRLTEVRFKNFALARSLCALRKKIDEEAEFLQEEQQKLVNAYAEFKDGQPVLIDDQHIKLKDTNAKKAFDAEMQRLYEAEITDIVAVKITESDFRSAEEYPTPDDMMALDGLVEFVE